MNSAVIIKHVEQGELADAYRVVRQLRPHLSQGDFVERITAQRRSGYELFGAFVDGTVVGALGCRPVITLARGNYLHIDDLVVDESVRGTHVGKKLMDFAREYADSNNMESIFLDAREEAVGFYQALGYTFHRSPSMTIRF